eukprot:388485-Alexandrium_andersonii.AAC.1
MRCRVAALLRTRVEGRVGRGVERTAARRALDAQIHARPACASPGTGARCLSVWSQTAPRSPTSEARLLRA